MDFEQKERCFPCYNQPLGSITVACIYHTEESVADAQILGTGKIGENLVLGRRDWLILASRIRKYR